MQHSNFENKFINYKLSLLTATEYSKIIKQLIQIKALLSLYGDHLGRHFGFFGSVTAGQIN